MLETRRPTRFGLSISILARVALISRCEAHPAGLREAPEAARLAAVRGSLWLGGILRCWVDAEKRFGIGVVFGIVDDALKGLLKRGVCALMVATPVVQNIAGDENLEKVMLARRMRSRELAGGAVMLLFGKLDDGRLRFWPKCTGNTLCEESGFFRPFFESGYRVAEGHILTSGRT